MLNKHSIAIVHRHYLVDFIKRGLTGKAADAALGAANITVNMNAVPNDPQSPFVTSGLRIGSPAITTRGFDEQDSRDLANWMCDILDDMGNDDVIASVREKVSTICKDGSILYLSIQI